MSDKELFVRLLLQWLDTKDAEYSNAVYYVDKQYWWQGYDVFGCYEALESRIRLDTFAQLAAELRRIISLFGGSVSNSTK